MLKRIVGKLFGFTARIESLEAQVKDLNFDPVFGIYNRSAFLPMCRKQPRNVSHVLCFLDFDGIHALNERLSYEIVNEKIRTLFQSGLRQSDLSFRHFSGDECNILLDCRTIEDGKKAISDFQKRAADLGLGFCYSLRLCFPSDDLEALVNEMSHEVMEQKKQRNDSRVA